MRDRSYSVSHRVRSRFSQSSEYYLPDASLDHQDTSEYSWPGEGGNSTLVSKSSVMTDDLLKVRRADRHLKGLKGLTRKRVRASLYDEVHECDHTQTSYDYLDGGARHVISYPWSLPGPDGIQTHTRIWQKGAFVLERLCVPGFPYNAESGTLRTTSSEYVGPDWFSMMHNFNEACNRLMPAKSILGESIVEHGVFLAPFKMLLNPSKFLKTFFRDVRRIGSARHSLLGQLVETAKVSASTLLGFQFGVSPAIDEIINVMSAFERVNNRIAFLNENRGGWIPIRVREVIPCEIVDNGFSSPPYPGTFTVERKTTYKARVATIGALGKVRDDIGQQEAWKYYMQSFGLDKVVGLAWELIPFSFVLDWFTNAQERINDIFSRFATSPFTAFKRFSVSITDVERQTHYCLPNAQDPDFGMNTWDKPTKPFPVVETVNRHYQRFFKIPSTSGVVDLRNLGLFHAISGGALIIQRLP